MENNIGDPINKLIDVKKEIDYRMALGDSIGELKEKEQDLIKQINELWKTKK